MCVHACLSFRYGDTINLTCSFTQGFWATLKQFLSSVLSGDRAHSSESSSFDSVWGMDEKTLSLECCWWLVASLAQLYCYDVDGQFASNPMKHVCWCCLFICMCLLSVCLQYT